MLAFRAHSSRWRRMVPISAKPIRSAMARNGAPASMGCNCWASPTSTTLAPLLRASASTRPSWRLPIMPASSITSTSRGPSRSLPCAQAHSSEAMVRLLIPASFCKPSAALPASAAPRTLNPWPSQAALAVLSIRLLPAPAAPATAAIRSRPVTCRTAALCSADRSGSAVKRGVYVRGAHAMRSGPRQALGLGHHIALGLDHRPRGEARGRPALPGRELPKLRRGHDPREDRLERRALVHVAVDFAGDVPAGEHGLPVGDKFQHALRPLRDLAGALGAGLLEILDALRGLARTRPCRWPARPCARSA